MNKLQHPQVASWLLSVICFLVAITGPGCGSEARWWSESFPAWQRHELLYLLPTPCDRLYVEIATVEGTTPPKEMVDVLRQTLAAHCQKPRGIHMAFDKPIPLAQTKGKCERQIAEEQIQGPPKEYLDGKTAFIYVLFYDSIRNGLSTQTCYVDATCPYVAFFDMSGLHGPMKYYQRQTMAHEVGHILGLCRNPARCEGVHCYNMNCAMGPRMVPLGTWLFSIPPTRTYTSDQYCADCRSDLESYKKLPPDPRMSFRGPFLVRQEKGYSVAVFPRYVELSLLEPGDRVQACTLEQVRECCKLLTSTDANFVAFRTIDGQSGRDARLREAEKDPLKSVSEMAKAQLGKQNLIHLMAPTTVPVQHAPKK